MPSPPQRDPSPFSAPQPAVLRRPSACQPVDRKHPFPLGCRSQISPEPSGLFLHPAQSSLDQKHPYPARSQTPGSLEPFGLFLHRAQSSLRAHSFGRVPSSPPFALRASLEAWPQSRAFFPSSLMVIPVRLAVAPTRLQPAPVNKLSVNW